MCVALLVAVSARVGESVAFSPWKPAIGVAAGLVMVGGLTFAIPVVVGYVAGALLLTGAAGTSNLAATALVTSLGAVLLGMTTRRALEPDPSDWSVRQVGLLIASALGTSLLLGLAQLWLGAPVDGTTASLYFRAAVGDGAGILLGLPTVACLMRMLTQPRDRMRAQLRDGDVGDLVLHAAFTLAVGAAAYTLHGPSGERFWSLYFIPMLWTGFRFGMPGLIGGYLLVSAQAIVLALLLRTPLTAITNYHFFFFNFCITSLLLGAALGSRRAAERAKGRSEALLAGAFRVTSDALVLFRLPDGEILDVNEAMEQLTGRRRDALVGTVVFTMPEWAPDTAAALRRIVERGEPVRELAGDLRNVAGLPRTVLMIVEVVTVDGGAFGVAFVRDITERQLLERQRLQSQKLEAVGLMAGGVAHDFNNILSVISANGQLLRETIPDGDERRADVDSILAAAHGGAQLTQQLLAFSRQLPDAPPKLIDAASVIQGMTTMLSRLFGANIRIVTELAPVPLMVTAVPGQLEQVVLNLAVNARDAMGEQGVLTIEASERHVRDGELVPELGSAVAGGRWMVIRVRDDGEGIDPAILSRIFEPFFTTKAEGKGTGLGLSTVYGIMRSVGGHVGVQSSVGSGTTFVLYWPGQRTMAAAGP